MTMVSDICTALVLIWGSQVDPYVQAAYFARSVGSTLTSQVFRPFLMSTQSIDSNSTKELLDLNKSSSMTGAVDLDTYSGMKDIFNKTENNTKSHFMIIESQFQYGYLIVSICLFSASIINFLIFCFNGATIRRYHKDGSTSKKHLNNITGKPRIVAIALQIAIGFFLGSVEDCFGGLLIAFLVKHLGWNEKRATDMNTVFFAASAISRLLGIPLAKFVRASKMLAFLSLLILSGYLTLTLTVNFNWNIPWLAVVLVGLGFGSSNASLINWSNSYMDLTGSNALFFLTSVALGGLASPPFVAYLFEKYSPLWYVYIGLIYAVILIVIIVVKYIFIWYLSSHRDVYVRSEEIEIKLHQ